MLTRDFHARIETEQHRLGAAPSGFPQRAPDKGRSAARRDPDDDVLPTHTPELDRPGAGARAIQFRGVSRKDVVVGITASGRTPFVWGALWEAGRRGAKTVLLCFNPRVEIPRQHRPDLILALNVGPEILTGSTRLKSGTATKLILNIFTTLAMVRTGKVISNLMVDLNPSNAKLRDRAVRIVRELTGADEATAKAALKESG